MISSHHPYITSPLSLYESMFHLLEFCSSLTKQPTSQNMSQSTLFDVIQSLPQTTKFQELIKANYFCMITFSHTYKLNHLYQVLQKCLKEYFTEYGSQSLAFTYKEHRFVLLMIRFNLIACSIKMHQGDSCQGQQFYAHTSQKHRKQLHQRLNQVLTQHIGEFHILRKLPERTQGANSILKNYELIFFHTFRLLQSIALSQNDQEKVILYKRAFQRIQKKSIISLNQTSEHPIIQKQDSITQNKQYGHKQPNQHSEHAKDEEVQKNTEAQNLLTIIQKNTFNVEQKKKKDFKLTSTKGSVRDLQRKVSNKHTDKQNSMC